MHEDTVGLKVETCFAQSNWRDEGLKWKWFFQTFIYQDCGQLMVRGKAVLHLKGTMNQRSLFSNFFPPFIHLPSPGKPNVTHPTNKPAPLGSVHVSWKEQFLACAGSVSGHSGFVCFFVIVNGSFAKIFLWLQTLNTGKCIYFCSLNRIWPLTSSLWMDRTAKLWCPSKAYLVVFKPVKMHWQRIYGWHGFGSSSKNHTVWWAEGETLSKVSIRVLVLPDK